MSEMLNSKISLLGISGLLVVWLGFFPPELLHAEEVMVHVAHDHVDPDVTVIKVGDMVSFHNHSHDHPAHIVAAEDGSFISLPLEGNDYWSYTFTKPGTYVYGVKNHPHAKGKIVVK